MKDVCKDLSRWRSVSAYLHYLSGKWSEFSMYVCMLLLVKNTNFFGKVFYSVGMLFS